MFAGGIIPNEDRPALLEAGVAEVFTPKDYELSEIMAKVADIAIAHRS